MTDEHADNTPEEIKPQLTFLHILCITSFIGSGWFFFSFLSCGIFFDSLGPAIKASPFAMQQEVMDMMPKLLAAGRWFFLTNAVFYGLSLFGAIRMWKLQKTGFHFYAMSQIMLLILPFLFMQGYSEALPQAMVTGIFIFSYASNLKFMKG